MQPIKLDLENLAIDSFQTDPAAVSDPSFLLMAAQDPALGPGGYCCTGCVSGCGYNPTASGCASGGGDTTLAY